MCAFALWSALSFVKTACRQSGGAGDSKYRARNAITQDVHECAVTHRKMHHWWRAELEDMSLVEKVTVRLPTKDNGV